MSHKGRGDLFEAFRAAVSIPRPRKGCGFIRSHIAASSEIGLIRRFPAARNFFGHFTVVVERRKEALMSILWIILIVVLVLALLGFFGFR
jgi:hypothetical protein